MDDEFFADRICMNCMSYKTTEYICNVCGFDETEYQPSPHHLPLRTILNGKYLVGRVLGEGGFGITYIGWDINLDLKIAIKEYYPTGFVTREHTVTNTIMPYAGEKTEFFLSGRDKFVDEAKRLAKFYSLPGIVSIKDFFLENSTAYLVMEYIEGKTLKQYLSDMGGKVPSEMIFDLMKPLMISLGEIHKAGIIHRDISPDNLMITKEGYIKLIDFGSARDFDNNRNKSLSIMLKPGYAPEEQYRTHGVQGPWTDIYALCATIYKSITGIIPDESCERIRFDSLKKPSELGLKISNHQEMVLMKGMSIFQENRFQSIDDLMNALNATTDMKVENPIIKEKVIEKETKEEETHERNEQLNMLFKNDDKYEKTNENNLNKKLKNTKVLIAILGIVIVIMVIVNLNNNDKKDIPLPDSTTTEAKDELTNTPYPTTYIADIWNDSSNKEEASTDNVENPTNKPLDIADEIDNGEDAIPTSSEISNETPEYETEDFMIYDSDSRYITEDDLYYLTEEEIRIARNEIYARKGRKFKDQALQDYFNQKSWYYGTVEPDYFTENYLNDFEHENVIFIKKYEKSMGYN